MIFTWVLAGLLCLLGAWYFGHYTKTPDYALQQIDQALEQGLEDIHAGRTISANDAFEQMRRDYHL